MIELVGIFLLCLTVITAVGVVRTKSLFAAVMLMGIFSLLMASSFLLLDAADVALTEAAVGAGISTVLMLSALALTGDRKEKPSTRPRALSLLVVVITAGTIFYATFDKPALGDPEAPIHQHVSPEYLEMTRQLIDIPNVVTAVLASFRGYDTFGEVLVVFTAGIGVLFLLGTGPKRRRRQLSSARGLKHHQPLRIGGKVVIPFIVLFAFYVQFHGEYSPGGGFQAGALFAAAVILYGLLEGERRGLAVLPPHILLYMAAGGALLFGGVGVVCMLLGGHFLDYSVLAPNMIAAQQLGILIIELGVGVTVAGVLLAIYHAFAARGVQ